MLTCICIFNTLTVQKTKTKGCVLSQVKNVETCLQHSNRQRCKIMKSMEWNI